MSYRETVGGHFFTYRGNNTMKQIAVVSDIHSNYAALQAVVADIRRRGIDQVFNLGDSLSGPMLPQLTAQFLIDAGWPSLAGNHERQLLDAASGDGGAADVFAASMLAEDALAWARSLPQILHVDDELLLCHGTPYNDCECLLESFGSDTLQLSHEHEIAARLGNVEARVIACGHSHLPRSVRLADGRLLVNPGSVGLPGYRAHQPHEYVVENGAPDARYAILEHEGDEWNAQLIAVPYHHQAMSFLAGRHGFLEWQRALATGYVR